MIKSFSVLNQEVTKMSFFDIFKKRKSQDIPAAEEKEPVFEEISFEEKAPYKDTIAGASDRF